MCVGARARMCVFCMPCVSLRFKYLKTDISHSIYGLASCMGSPSPITSARGFGTLKYFLGMGLWGFAYVFILLYRAAPNYLNFLKHLGDCVSFVVLCIFSVASLASEWGIAHFLLP